MEHLLLHPPFADPTQPFLSLPTLKGALRARGLDARVVDLNVEAAHALFERPQLEALAERLCRRFRELDGAAALSFDEQLEYRRVVEARGQLEEVLAAEPAPIEVFQSRELFFDPVRYTLARRQADALFEVLSAAHYPYRFGFNHAAHTVLPWSFDLLERYAEERRSPLADVYERVLLAPDDWDWSRDPRGPIDVASASFVGISVVFPSQIPEAFYLCRALRRMAPGAFVALGGPCIHQIAVHLEPELRLRLLAFADGIGLFEGEETLAALLPLLPAWRSAGSALERYRCLAEVPNLLLLDPSSGAPAEGPRHVLDLRHAEAPDYSDLDLDRYLAPSRTLLYAPTRGCYWNKCSFCYYGLAETATASYREVPPERAAADLAHLARRHGVRDFYVSCDVLSPSYAMRFAEAIVARDLRIRWSSDLKIEKAFTPERCALLHRSGLRSAAFGIESGSDRILDLMRKGTDRATMTRVNRAFHEAGIATEWMTFTDHPGESYEEALETVRWIEAESDWIDLFIVGRFGLERGSHVAQEPARYGVAKVYYAEGDELRLYALFTQRTQPRSAEEEEALERAIDRVAAPYALRSYPWAGANSTHHSFLWFLQYGQGAFKSRREDVAAASRRPLPRPALESVPGLRDRPRFSLERIAEAEEAFLDRYLPEALYTTLSERRHGREVAPLSRAHFEAAVRTVAPLSPVPRRGARG